MSLGGIIVIALALGFDYTNGFHDAANSIATVVATRVLTPVQAVIWAAFWNFAAFLVLLALPWVNDPGAAVAIFLLRESLVQMDVPTRQAYVAAVTAPGERTFAMSVTGLTRNVGWSVGPALAGLVMGPFGVGAPLVCGAVTKAVYDVLLYRAFRKIGPVEQQTAGAG